jgi:hypothetical protein
MVLIDAQAVTPMIEPEEHEHVRMGTGSCTLCDCPSFRASPGPGNSCINLNSAGGTCNHWDYEHN